MGKAGGERGGHGPATIGIHAGSPEPVPGAPVVLPVVQSATFFGGAGEPASQLLYSRYGNNPNQALAGEKMAALPVEIARDREILLAVDATFASPVNIRFADLGVGAVIHSATKYLGGHSDLVAGVVSGSSELIERVRSMMKLYGPAPDPHMGIPDVFVRISVGLEDVEDLKEDFGRALAGLR